ncbi:MAG: hypothetical protein HYR63_10500 [Proteobacteria bacterium]|nr:hypothetical protein [Pseudomonadota bacterium]
MSVRRLPHRSAARPRADPHLSCQPTVSRWANAPGLRDVIKLMRVAEAQ